MHSFSNVKVRICFKTQDPDKECREKKDKYTDTITWGSETGEETEEGR